VIEVRPDDNRALVRGVNMVKRHQRQSAQQEGGIISKESTIHLSNLAIADPKDGKPTRVGFKFTTKPRNPPRRRRALPRPPRKARRRKVAGPRSRRRA